MPRSKISEYSATANSNTDVAGINVDEGCAPSGINNAIRAVMGHLKDFQTGTASDPLTVGGAFTTSSTVTHNGGTANGVAYLNGSKVLTTGSALVFNGTQLGVGTSSFDGNWTPALQVVSSASDGTGGIMIESYRPSLIFKDDSASAVRQHIVADGSALIFGSGDASFTEKARIDSSGNLGLGVTPSAWSSSAAAIQFPAGFSVSRYGAAQNLYYDGSNYKAITTGLSTLYQPTSGAHVFYSAASVTAGSTATVNEVARIDSAGRLMVGVSSPTGFITFSNPTPSDFTVATLARNSSGNSYCHYSGITGQTPNNVNSIFYYGSDATALRFNVYSNGGIANYSANNVNLSDRREKTNFTPAKSYLDVICAIPVQTYNYIDQNLEEDGGLTLGVVAQDVQAVAPELVTESDWSSAKDGSKMRLSIYQTDMQYALMKCIQELKAELDAAKARITTLEA